MLIFIVITTGVDRLLREGSLFLDALQVAHERHIVLTSRKIVPIPIKSDHIAAVTLLRAEQINEDRTTDAGLIVRMQPPHSLDTEQSAVLESVEFNMMKVPAVVSLHFLRMWERANVIRRYGIARLLEGIRLTRNASGRRNPDFYCHGFLTSNRFRLITLRLFSKMKTKLATAAKTLKLRWSTILLDDFGAKKIDQAAQAAAAAAGDADPSPPPLATCIPLSLLNKEGVFPTPKPKVALNAVATMLRLAGTLEYDLIFEPEGRVPPANAAPANVNNSRVGSMVTHQKARQVPRNPTCKIVTMEYLLMKQSVLPNFPCVLSAIRSLVDLSHNLLKFMLDQFNESSSLKVLIVCNDRVQDYDRNVLHPRFPNGMVQTNDYNNPPTVSMSIDRETAITAAMKDLLKHEAYVALFYRHFADHVQEWCNDAELLNKWKKEKKVLNGKTVRLYMVPTIVEEALGVNVPHTYASHKYETYGFEFSFDAASGVSSKTILQFPEVPSAPQSALHAAYVAFHETDKDLAGFSGDSTDVIHIVSTQPDTVLGCLEQCAVGVRSSSHKSSVFVSLPGVYTLDITGEMNQQVDDNEMALPTAQIGAAPEYDTMPDPLVHDMDGLRHAQTVMLYLFCANDDSPKIAPLSEQQTIEGWLLYSKEMALYGGADAVKLYRDNICLVHAVSRLGVYHDSQKSDTILEGNFKAVLRFITFLYLRLNLGILDTPAYSHWLFHDGDNSSGIFREPCDIVEELFEMNGYKLRDLIINDSRSFPPLEV